MAKPGLRPWRRGREAASPSRKDDRTIGKGNGAMNLLSLLYGFGPWDWLFLAILLFALETMIPGVHFLWFGIAAMIVGGLALAAGIAWPWQVLAFGIFAPLSVFLVRRFVRPEATTSDLPQLNARGQQYIG